MDCVVTKTLVPSTTTDATVEVAIGGGVQNRKQYPLHGFTCKYGQKPQSCANTCELSDLPTINCQAFGLECCSDDPDAAEWLLYDGTVPMGFKWQQYRKADLFTLARMRMKLQITTL